MKIDTGLAVSRLQDVPAAARAAEEAGFDGIWSFETSHDPFLPLALAAEHTQRIELGTSIAVAFPRSPLVHAQIAWDLQALSGGRFILGLGTQVKGHNERRFGVKWEQPGPRLREMVQVIHAIWDCWQDGKKPEFEGKFYNFTLMTPFFHPGPLAHPRPPIYIAGVNDYVCRLAGELCDGFHVHPLHSLRYLDEVARPLIRAGLAASGRPQDACKLSTSAFVITGRNEAEIEAAKAPVRQQIAFYASTRTYRKVLEVHGWQEMPDRLNARAARGDWAGMADEITDEMLDVYATVGTLDEIAAKVRRKYDGYLDRVTFYFPFQKGDGRPWQEWIEAIHG